MKKRIAKRILKNKDKINYSRQQLEKAEKKQVVKKADGK